MLRMKVEETMRYGKLTPREAEIIHRLLAERSITRYEIVQPVAEGTPLPGSHDDFEIELLSGTIVTATKVYGFWLDWNPIAEEYTLGEHNGYWQEVDLDKVLHPQDILEAQQRLRQGGG